MITKKEDIYNVESIKEPIGKTKTIINDVIFKAVFENNKDILVKMIKDIFEIEEDVDEEPLTIKEYQTVPVTKEGRTFRSDIVIKLSDNSYVCLEMNSSPSTSIIERNIIQMIRVHSSVIKNGTSYEELKKYKMRGLNFNLIENIGGDPVEYYAFCNIKTGKIASLIYSFCNVDLEMCHDLVYDINVRNLSNAVRWGAILIETEIDNIAKILGDDMLNMEDKDRLIKTIEEVNDDEQVLKEWMVLEKAKMVYDSDIAYAKKEGLDLGLEVNKLEVIKNMLKENTDYNFISKVTGKSVEEIKDIESNM